MKPPTETPPPDGVFSNGLLEHSPRLSSPPRLTWWTAIGRHAKPARLIASVLLVLGGWAAQPSTALAADCGCNPWSQHRCDACTYDVGPGPVYRTLDAFAGGIERLLGLDKHPAHCDRSGCDDACDAALLHEMQMPRGEVWEVAPPNMPSELRPVRPAQPGSQGAEPRRMPPERDAEPLPSPEQDGGSIFDALSDPFEDDSASSRRSQRSRPIRRSSYRRPGRPDEDASGQPARRQEDTRAGKPGGQDASLQPVPLERLDGQVRLESPVRLDRR